MRLFTTPANIKDTLCSSVFMEEVVYHHSKHQRHVMQQCGATQLWHNSTVSDIILIIKMNILKIKKNKSKIQKYTLYEYFTFNTMNSDDNATNYLPNISNFVLLIVVPKTFFTMHEYTPASSGVNFFTSNTDGINDWYFLYPLL